MVVTHPRAKTTLGHMGGLPSMADATYEAKEEPLATPTRLTNEASKAIALQGLQDHAAKLMRYVKDNIDYRIQEKLSFIDSSALRELFTLCAAYQIDNVLSQKDIDDFLTSQRDEFMEAGSTFLEGLEEIK